MVKYNVEIVKTENGINATKPLQAAKTMVANGNGNDGDDLSEGENGTTGKLKGNFIVVNDCYIKIII